jgi:hypothetical protein
MRGIGAADVTMNQARGSASKAISTCPAAAAAPSCCSYVPLTTASTALVARNRGSAGGMPRVGAPARAVGTRVSVPPVGLDTRNPMRRVCSSGGMHTVRMRTHALIADASHRAVRADAVTVCCSAHVVAEVLIVARTHAHALTAGAACARAGGGCVVPIRRHALIAAVVVRRGVDWGGTRVARAHER